MRTKELRRIILVVPLLLIFYTGFLYLRSQSPGSCHQINSSVGRTFCNIYDTVQQKQEHVAHQVDIGGSAPGDIDDDDTADGYGELSLPDPNETHTELFSVSTPDRKYFRLRFGDQKTINPNIIPHPLLENTWVIVAQQHDPEETTHTQFIELACDAAFDESNSELRCLFPPIPLPIAPTGLGNCKDELEFFSLNVGPHDARVFYGPQTLLTIYGSNSHETCFGQWIQDFRVLVNWRSDREDDQEQERPFKLGTELHRPNPNSVTEKNWFVFWDADSQMYAHYDIAPRRAFARLNTDGSATGPDLAPLAAAAGDEQCMDKYMPQPGPEHESIHQATNSLSVTMCRRHNPDCEPNDGNTFLFTIFQHKTFRDFHSVYEPYVMVFQRRPPFEVYGISRKPLWIHGRETQSQMFYVTSVSWKVSGQRYHGYLDDVLFLGFGIEDRESAGIDVLASDLLADLNLCVKA
ncbi:hypothetical protein F4821DRAFT_274473 [Hypoxylon rubiginosum]|uniref:Uncharacterized protein n=1 Tax=Hypoxylon rubiginosum TaxID=110542 RepID=A0ACC0CNM0_9PEZI|nr:hypothetical protein F4821DRAFT_274473 [Hypoxylon rubiginosum]